MLRSGEKMYAYPFQGYWKDVGTAVSLWESNMDLLNSKDNILTQNSDWKIFSRNPVVPPHYISPNAKIINSIISEGCTLEGEIYSSVIFDGVKVEEGATVYNSIIMPCTKIGKGSTIKNAIIDENVKIGRKVSVGSTSKKDDNETNIITVIGNHTFLDDGIVTLGNNLEGIEVV
jgi:glucose-1-phosphate adenylyltransferase